MHGSMKPADGSVTLELGRHLLSFAPIVVFGTPTAYQIGSVAWGLRTVI
jgi:hypothetical protein